MHKETKLNKSKDAGVYDKGLSRIHKELLQLLQVTQVKMGKELGRHFYTEDTQMANKDMKKCIIKQQGDTSENHNEIPFHTH